MPYTEFHYTPTGTGVISGKEVLEQTEDAINDLGGQISGDVQTAIDTANNALNTANTASADAQNAVNTANTAYTAATNAQNTANTAQNTASNALTAAQNAQNDVNALGKRVTTAENNISQNTSDISGLTTRMRTAEGNITTLRNDVITAQGTATSAQNTATLARGQAYVVRYASVAVSDNSTVPYTDLNNTDNVKANDLLLDINGKLYQISSVDTANETVSVTTPLTQLAVDSGVVHKSGNETVGGYKTFSVTPYIYNSDSTANEPNIIFRNSKYAKGDTTNTGEQRLVFTDSSNTYVGQISSNKNISGTQYLAFTIYTTDNNNANLSSTINYYLAKNGDRYFTPYEDNLINLGVSNRRWKNVYAINYYYGSNNVEFSTKFVTTDTNQTISGNKTFNSDLTVANTDTTANTPNLNLRNYKADRGTVETSVQTIVFSDKNAKTLTLIESRRISNGNTTTNILTYNTDDSNNTVSGGVSIIKSKTDTNFAPNADNAVTCGRPLARWSQVYGTEYYYGSNNVEFSTKFVTTDTNQTISGSKTFSDNLTIYNSDDTVTPKGLIIRNAQWGMGESGATTVSNINFLDKNSSIPASVMASKGLYGQSFLRFSVKTKDSQNKTYSEEIYYDIDTSGNVEFRAWHDNTISMGTSASRWKDVQTYKVNSVEPSSLSLPSGNVNDVIDISSYITDLSGNVNNYTAPANGWISIAVVGTAIAIVSSSWSDSRLRASSGNVRMLYPVLKNETLDISVIGTTLDYARFIPCQGNV